jgi:hypothetical protein
MSALPPKADIAEFNRHVRFGSKADIGLIRSPRLRAGGTIREWTLPGRQLDVC